MPAQLLHGPTFSLMWLSAVVYGVTIAPAGLGASAQAALGATFMGLGAGAGALIGAWLYGNWGPVVAFRGSALIALAGLALFGLSVWRVRRATLVGS